MCSTSRLAAGLLLAVAVLLARPDPAPAQYGPGNQTLGDLTAVATLDNIGVLDVTLALKGRPGAGFHLDNIGSFVGTLVAEISADGGTSWHRTEMIRAANPFFVPMTQPQRVWLLDRTTGISDEFVSILVPGGASHVRVRIRNFTSGTAPVTLRATLARADFSYAPPSPTFYCLFANVAPNLDKYMATLFNASTTRKVVVRRVYVLNNQITAVTGILLEQLLVRITARTVVTNIPVDRYDLNDTLSTGIACDTGSASVTASTNVRARIFATGEEVTLAGDTVATWLRGESLQARVYECRPGERCLTLRQTQGISIQNVTSSTVGTLGYLFVFTDEADNE